MVRPFIGCGCRPPYDGARETAVGHGLEEAPGGRYAGQIMGEHDSIRLLGGVRVVIGGRTLDLAAGMAQAIVARLALTPGETVSTAELVSALWHEPPATAAGTLRAYLSRLRSGGLAGVLDGGRGGYSLTVAPECIDVVRFRQLVATSGAEIESGRSARAGLTEALELVDGEPLAGLDSFPFVPPARARLREEHRAAIEALAALQLEKGEHAQVIASIAPAVDEHPLHENLVRLLATALARAGRTSDALAALDGFRERLLDAQGLDPSREFDDLRQSIVRHDPVVVSVQRGESAIVRHGIPVPLTTLVGRVRELELVGKARAESRLVTLVGPGGVGKTRLAVESARRSTASIDIEQWMVDLSTLDVGGDPSAATAEAIGALDHSIEAIGRRLGGTPVLLVIDNAEHVIAGVRRLVRGLLDTVAGLSVLVTSREALGLPGERVVRVDPMIGSAAQDAVELYLQRATDARGGVRPPPEAEGRIRQLCRLLDGLPLALELAAARSGYVGLVELAASLAEGRGIPGTSATGGRQDSLEGAIRWSTDHLSPDELELLVQLSGFAGPFTLDAAVGVCRLDGADVLSVALSLVQKSLVAAEETESGARRFRMLESIKAFARPLHDGDAWADWSERHRAWFAAFVDQQEPLLQSLEAKGAHAALDSASADLQLALENSIAAGDRDTALRIAGGQTWHWFTRGLLRDGRAAVDRARAVPGGSPPGPEALALLGAVNLAYQGGDSDAAFEYVRLGIEKAQEAGDRETLAAFLAYVAYGRSLFGELDEAELYLQQAMALIDGAPAWLRSEVLMARGQTLRALGRPAQALDSLVEARRIAAEVGHAWIVTSSEYVTGKVLIDVRRPKDALAVLAPGAARALAGGDPTSALALLHLCGGAFALIERHRDGARLFGAVDALGRRFSYNPVTAEGADAQAHRDAVAAGLTRADYEAAYAEGTALGYAEALSLAGSAVRP
jgi:predicted ATPase/DNA-binding SARP family transcriptional activator